jgi:hypothetical protein
MEGTTLTVASKTAQFTAREFSEWIDQRQTALQTILETVKKEVGQQHIEPLVAARISSCVAGSVYGYEEFHPRGPAPSAEQLLEALSPEGLLAAGR